MIYNTDSWGKLKNRKTEKERSDIMIKVKEGDYWSQGQIKDKTRELLSVCKSRKHFENICHRFFFKPELVVRWDRKFRCVVIRRHFPDKPELRPELIFVNSFKNGSFKTH